MSAHSEYPPSSVERWLNCPVSLKRIRAMMGLRPLIPPEGKDAVFDSNPWADAGTWKHGIVSWRLAGRKYSENGTAAFRDELEPYMRHCRNLINSGARYWIEGRWYFDYLLPAGSAPAFGTADFVAYFPEVNALEIVDAKFGQRVISAYKNRQMGTYALAVKHSLRLDNPTVTTTIVQPRAPEPVTAYTWERDELAMLELAIATAAANPDTAKAGKWCEFCPVKANCLEYSVYECEEMGFRPVD